MRGVRFVREVCDRFWMFTIAAISLIVVGFVCAAILWNGKMPEGSEGLLTAAITGLLMVAQNVIKAVVEMMGASGKPDDPVNVKEAE